MDNLSIAELLILLLFEHNSYRGNQVVPYSITQKGIQEELGCDSGYLSRLLKTFESEGIIERKLLIIEDKNRKQHIPFLTDKGQVIAIEIHNKKLKSEPKKLMNK